MNNTKVDKKLIQGIKTMFKEFFNANTNKKQRANMWTFSRLILPFFSLITSIIGIIYGIAPLMIASSIIVAFGGLTDFFDGRSARKHNSTSEFGKLLDQITDKVFAGVVAINVAIINPIYIPVLLFEMAIGTVNTFYKRKYPDIDDKSALIGRIKQYPLFISLGTGFLSNLNSILQITSNVLVLITLAFQALTLSHYATTKYKIAKKMDRISEYKDKNELKVVEEEHNKNKTKSLEYDLKTNYKDTTKSFQKIKKKNR